MKRKALYLSSTPKIKEIEVQETTKNDEIQETFKDEELSDLSKEEEQEEEKDLEMYEREKELEMFKEEEVRNSDRGLLKTFRRKKTMAGVINVVEEKVIDPDDAEIVLQKQNLPTQQKEAIKELQLKGEYFGFNFQADQDQEDLIEGGMDEAKEYDQQEEQRLFLERIRNKGRKQAPVHRTKQNLVDIVQSCLDKDGLRQSIQGNRGSIKNQDGIGTMTLHQLMRALEEDKSWTYIRVLISFLRKKGPFWYTKRPGLYDRLSKALIHMNNDSVDGLVQVYKLTTFWPQEVYSGFPRYSKLKSDNQEMIRGQGFGQSLQDKYIQSEEKKRNNIPQAGLVEEPFGQYNNQAKIAAWAIPMNVTYGSKDSIAFLKSLENCKNNEIFKIPVVQGYLNYKWDQAKIFLTIEAILHAFYLISFNVFAITTAARDSWAAKGFVFVFSALFLVREILQMCGRKSTYFKDPWNYPDLGMIFCSITAAIIDPIDEIDDTVKQWIFVLAIVLQWTRVLSYFRLWGRTRHLIRTITQTVSDMVPFLFIVFGVIFAYSSAKIAAYEEEKIGQFDYNLKIFDAFQLLSGNNIYDEDNDITYFVFTLISLVGLIVLLNMLIALMGDTFARVQGNKVVYDYRERLSVNIDLESMIYLCMRKAKPHVLHIGIIRRPGGFEAEGTEWQGAQTEVKKVAKIGFRDINKDFQKFFSDYKKG